MVVFKCIFILFSMLYFTKNCWNQSIFELCRCTDYFLEKMETWGFIFKNLHWTYLIFQTFLFCSPSYGLLFLPPILSTPLGLQIIVGDPKPCFLFYVNQLNFLIALAPHLKISTLTEDEDNVCLEQTEDPLVPRVALFRRVA